MTHARLQQTTYDVAICGAGFAGLTLALQLKRQFPLASVALIDSLTRPLPEATFKVGESTTEAGTFYLEEVLSLSDYLEKNHLNKLGFRFFFGGADSPFKDRPEFGISKFPRVRSYNLDRGVFENDLRSLISDKEVVLLEGFSVDEIRLAKRNGVHRIVLKDKSDGRVSRLRARWVVDAMGRRRYLQKKLGLTRANGSHCCSVWFRLEGRVDISDLVAATEDDWHGRVPGRQRYYSTNHLMGDGYWVWLIPLSSGKTSVGIVTIESLHPFERYNTYPRAISWLGQNEPVLAGYIGGRKCLDFRCMRRYSYSSRKIFSEDRWACVGDAAFFTDPLYAPSTDLIALTNSAVTELILQEASGKMSAETVNDFNSGLIALNDVLTHNIQAGYPFFGNPAIMASKVIWDTAGGWAFLAPQVFNSIFTDPVKSSMIRNAKAPFFFLTKTMHELFVEWAAASPGRMTFDFIDFLKIPFLRELRDRNLQAGKPVDVLVEDHKLNLERMEELAQAIFLVAVEEVMPEELKRFRKPVWLNAWRLCLRPERWEENGLFRPFSNRRDFTKLHQKLRSMFTVRSPMTRPEISNQLGCRSS